MSQEFLVHLKEHEIIAHRTPPYMPQHNEEDTHSSENTSSHHDEGDQEIYAPQSDIIPIRRSIRTRHALDRIGLYIDDEEYELEDLNEPANHKAALLDPESDKWRDAMNVEMQSMKDNKVWDLVDLPPNDKIVGSKWLFKKKTDMDGAVKTYKARPVTKGFTQTYEVDYEETFSLVADIKAIRILIAIVAFYDYEIWQIDVKNAFLNSHLSEEVYMVQPEVMENHIPMLQDVKSYIGKLFAMKDLGEAAYILKIKIYRDRSRRLIGLCQNAYIDKNLKRFYMDNSKRRSIPMQEKLKLSKSQGASTPAENLGELHWNAVKNILMYLHNTKDMFLVYEEAEYIAALDASKEAVWVRKFIYRLGVVPIIEEPIKMYCDNTRALTIANESRITKGARHYRAKVHYLREVIKFGDIKIKKRFTQMIT
nr:retrotransposon protein, putative, Ty1-copia subclass [Tanacetum cinerariifolium]